MIIRIMVIRYTLHRLRMNMRKPRGDIVVAQAGHSLNCKGENLIFIQISFTYRLMNCILQGLTTLRIDWFWHCQYSIAKLKHWTVFVCRANKGWKSSSILLIAIVIVYLVTNTPRLLLNLAEYLRQVCVGILALIRMKYFPFLPSNYSN